MVKQIYTQCDDPLFGMLVLKTVPLVDVKELPDKIFFGCPLNTNLPRPGTIDQSYDERYINQSASGGNLPSTRDFSENDPVWVKINEQFPWPPGIVVKVHLNQSFDMQVDNKVYRCNTQHLTRRYPHRVPNTLEKSEDDSSIRDTPQVPRLRHRPKVKMPRIPYQAMVHQDFMYL